MAKKTGIIHDSFEQVAEFGADTAKKTVRSLVETFIPQFTSSPESPKSPKKSHTPLDFEKLGKKFDDNEKYKKQALLNRLFQMRKGEEEKLSEEDKRKKEEKKRQELMIEQEKIRREKEQRQIQNQLIPQGKKRRSIFSQKKVASREQMEVKPASGKQ